MFISKGRYGYGDIKKCNRLLGAVNVLAFTCLSTTQFHAASNRADKNLGIFRATYRYCVFTKAMPISKKSYGYGEFENIIAFTVQ